MTRTRKALIVVLSVLCLVCMGVFTLTACSKKTLSSIKVTTQPTKTEYEIGETFNADGMVVTAKYSDNTEKVLERTDWDYDVKDALTVPDGKYEATQDIKITYEEDKVTADATVKVKVTNYIASATIKAYPNTEYFLGQAFNVDGLILDATLKSGKKIEVNVANETYKVSPNGALGKDDKEVTVTVYGYDVKIPVTVLNALYVEAETGYLNGATIDPNDKQSSNSSGKIRDNDANEEKSKEGAKAIYEAQLKADFALEELRKGDNFDEAALKAAPSADANYNGVTVGGQTVNALYDAIVAWLNDETNKEAIETYVKSEAYTTAVETYLASKEYEEAWQGFLAHDGQYLGQLNQGDVISFLFDSSEATTGNIAFRLASSYLVKDNGNWTSVATGDLQFNKIFEFYVNGVKYNIDDSVILEGGMTPDGSAINVLWCNWKEVPFNDVAFVAGRNVIELRILNHGITSPAQTSYNFAANIDTLLVAPSQKDGKDSSDLDTYPSNAKATAKATNVTLSAEGVVTVTGTYEGVKGYVGDLLGISVGDASAVVSTDIASGTFTATVDVSKFDLGSYTISATKGDDTTVSSEAVKIGYNTLTLVIDGNTLKLVIDSDHKVAVTKAEIGTPVITLENRDGKACLVVAGGTYEATVEEYTAEEAKPLIEAAIAKLYYSDLQNNPNEGGLSGWDMVVTNTHFVNILADNKFEVVIDLTNLKLTTMTMHFVHANEDGTFPTGGASDFKPDIAAFESNLELPIGDKMYEVIYDKTTYFSCVGVKISEYGKPEIAPNSIEFKVEDNKVYYVVNITFKNYETEADVRASITQLDFQGDPLVVFKGDDLAAITTVDMTAGTMTIKADITDLPLAEYYWTHLFIDGKSSDLAINYDNVTPVECNGKLYENKFITFSWGTRYLLAITDPTAPVKVTIGSVNNDQGGFDAKGKWTYGIMSSASKAGTTIGTHEIVDDTLTIGFKNISNDVNSRFYYMSDQAAGTKIKITATAKLNVDGALKLSLAVTDSIDLTADTEKEITIEYTVGAEKGNGPIRFHLEVGADDKADVELVLSNLKIEVVTDTPAEGGEETPAE